VGGKVVVCREAGCEVGREVCGSLVTACAMSLLGAYMVVSETAPFYGMEVGR